MTLEKAICMAHFSFTDKIKKTDIEIWMNDPGLSGLHQPHNANLVTFIYHMFSELQIREGIEHNSKIIFLISQQKRML